MFDVWRNRKYLNENSFEAIIKSDSNKINNNYNHNKSINDNYNHNNNINRQEI